MGELQLLSQKYWNQVSLAVLLGEDSAASVPDAEELMDITVP